MNKHKNSKKEDIYLKDIILKSKIGTSKMVIKVADYFVFQR